MLKKISEWISNFVSETRNEKTDLTKIVCMFTIDELKHIRNACNIVVDIKKHLNKVGWIKGTNKIYQDIINKNEQT